MKKILLVIEDEYRRTMAEMKTVSKMVRAAQEFVSGFLKDGSQSVVAIYLNHGLRLKAYGVEDAEELPQIDVRYEPVKERAVPELKPGMFLVGNDGDTETVIQIIAVGEEKVIAKAILHNRERIKSQESVWDLSCRDWRECGLERVCRCGSSNFGSSAMLSGANPEIVCLDCGLPIDGQHFWRPVVSD